jgi:hypothetical protein
MVWGYWLW